MEDNGVQHDDVEEDEDYNLENNDGEEAAGDVEEDDVHEEDRSGDTLLCEPSQDGPEGAGTYRKKPGPITAAHICAVDMQVNISQKPSCARMYRKNAGSRSAT